MPLRRRISKLLVVATLLSSSLALALATPVAAQPGAWLVRPVPGNGDAIADVSCATATRCVGVSGYSSEVIASANGGLTWRVYQPRGVSRDGFTSVDCLTSGSCYATAMLGAGGSAGAALYESVSGGRTWRAVLERRTPTNHRFRFNQVTCVSPSHCLVSGTDGSRGFILETTTAWRAWSHATVPAQPAGGSILGVSCASATACFAVQGTTARVYKSTDGGRRWRALPVPESFAPYERNPATPTGLSAISCGSPAFCVAGGYIGHLDFTGTTQPFKWVTRDGGATWSFLNPFASTGARTSNAVGQNAISCPTSAACTLGLSYGLVYATSDRGLDWIWDRRTPQSDNDVMSVACPSTSHCVISAMSNFPEKSVFAGMLWVER